MSEQRGHVSLRDIQPKLNYGWRLLLTIVAVLVVALAVGTLRRSARTENDLVPATKVELNALSIELEKGSFSQGEDQQPVFMGTVSTWPTMNRDRKLKVATEIRDGLASRDIATASVYSGEALAFQIAQGKVLIAE